MYIVKMNFYWGFENEDIVQKCWNKPPRLGDGGR